MDITKRFNRIVAIYFQLQAKPMITAHNLAERFGVSKRTIYRDLKSLEQAGVPIYGEPGTGYSLVDGFKLSPPRFSEDEILTLAAAEKLMQKFGDLDLSNHFSSAISKVKSFLRYNEKINISVLEENMVMGEIGERFNHNVPSALSKLFEGISQRKIIDMDYQSGDAINPARREIEPVGVFHQSNFWYFIAYCHLRSDYRQFRIDRIHKLSLSSRSFTRTHKPLSHYLKQDKAPLTTRIRLSIPVQFARHLYWERSYFGFLSEEIDGNEVIMTFECPNMEHEFSRWYLMFADQAKILEPEELRGYVKKLLDKIKI